jgi:hypothetical protein
MAASGDRNCANAAPVKLAVRMVIANMDETLMVQIPFEVIWQVATLAQVTEYCA